MSRRLLLFHISADKKKCLENIGKKLNIELTDVKQVDYEQKLGYLAGISGFKREIKIYKGMEFPKEMIIFSGIDSECMDLFFSEYKKTGLPGIELKAAITMTNINWTPLHLFGEILKEHTIMFSKNKK